MANPFMAASTSSAVTDSTKPLPLFREMDWDFEKNEFKYDASENHVILTGNEGLKLWIKKALMVERYRYRAYFDDYGLELEHFIGKMSNDMPSASELFVYVKDALVVNPYIISVLNASFTQGNKIVTLNVSVTTVYGDATIGIEV